MTYFTIAARESAAVDIPVPCAPKLLYFEPRETSPCGASKNSVRKGAGTNHRFFTDEVIFAH